MSDSEVCEVCGEEDTAYMIDVMHRGCRLGAAFPDAANTDDSGLVTLDMEKVAIAVGWEPIRTDCDSCGGTGNAECRKCNSIGSCHDCCDQVLAQIRARPSPSVDKP